jgi:hypothetical protein
MVLTPASRAAGGQVGLATALAAVGLLYLLSSRGDEPGGVGRDPVRVITPNQQVNCKSHFFICKCFSLSRARWHADPPSAFLVCECRYDARTMHVFRSPVLMTILSRRACMQGSALSDRRGQCAGQL